MIRIKCTLPNASADISGVKFEPVEGGMLSEPVSEAIAARFASIVGYTIINEEQTPAALAAEVKPAVEGARRGRGKLKE